MRGLLAVGAYVPYARLDRRSIAEALGVPAGSGTRVVASYDEDTTSMGVEAARAALRGSRVTPDALYFATSDPAYLDKTNATAIHAALDLPASTMAVDMAGAVRSGAGALRAALDAHTPGERPDVTRIVAVLGPLQAPPADDDASQRAKRRSHRP